MKHPPNDKLIDSCDTISSSARAAAGEAAVIREM